MTAELVDLEQKLRLVSCGVDELHEDRISMETTVQAYHPVVLAEACSVVVQMEGHSTAVELLHRSWAQASSTLDEREDLTRELQAELDRMVAVELGDSAVVTTPTRDQAYSLLVSL